MASLSATQSSSGGSVSALLAKMAWGVTRIEQALSETRMLAGDEFSLADISILAIVQRISEIEPDLLDPTRVPHVLEWREHVTARPSALASYAQQSDEFPARPKANSISGLTGPWRYS